MKPTYSSQIFKLAVKEFFRGAVIQHLPWQTVDAIGEKADIIGSIVGYAPTLQQVIIWFSLVRICPLKEKSYFVFTV